MESIRCLVQYCNNLSTRKKLLISYMLVVFIPVLLVGLLLTFSLRSMAINNAIKEANLNVERVTKRIKDILETPVTVSMKFYGSSTLENIIYQEYNTDWDIIETYYNYNEFDELKGLYREVEDIRLYVPNEEMIDNWRFARITDEVKKLKWFQEAIEKEGKIIWRYIDIPGRMAPNPSLSMIRALKSSSGKFLGVLVVKLDGNEMNRILGQESFETLVVDEEGLVIAAQDSAITGKNITSHELGLPIDNRRGIEDIVYKGKPAKMISNVFFNAEGDQQFKVISIFSLDEILSGANYTSLLAFVIIAGSLALSLGLIILFSRALSMRINQISKDMHKVAAGDFEFSFSIEGNDEVGQLSKDLNTMIGSIKRLMTEVYESNLQKKNLLVKQKEIKFRMLANQINPHFLFNALEAIRMEAVSEGATKIARVVKLLGKIMRMTLKVSNESIPLEVELDLVKSYLEIQKFRYPDKISYNIHEIKPGLLYYKLMPLIIQPIVENAIVHGLENKEQGGTVDIQVLEREDVILIRVMDDGIGMNEERLKRIQESLDEPDDYEGRRIGLRNIHQRIKLFYGDDYGISVTSKYDQGTTVEVILPRKDDLDA